MNTRVGGILKDVLGGSGMEEGKGLIGLAAAEGKGLVKAVAGSAMEVIWHVVMGGSVMLVTTFVGLILLKRN